MSVKLGLPCAPSRRLTTLCSCLTPQTASLPHYNRAPTTRSTRQITLNIYPGAGQQDLLLTLDAFPDMLVSTLRQSIQAETAVPPGSQYIYHNGILVTDDAKTMQQLRISDGDMLAVHVRSHSSSLPPSSSASTPYITASSEGRPRPGPAGRWETGGIAAGPGTGAGAIAGERAGAGLPAARRQPELDTEMIRLNILGNPAVRQEVVRRDPRLAAALDSPQRFAQVFRESQNLENQEHREQQRRIQRLNADPFDIENQTKIEEMIRYERVMENLQSAMEHNPEVFGRVHMLYIDVEVNGNKVKALVDSGAQATIMSPSCAEACGVMRLVDKRFAGVARGVGTAAIIGRVHSAQIKIGPWFLPCSFTVMEGKSVDLLLGLDMLKRHQACIDLVRDRLVIQGQDVPFLGEAEIPKDVEDALVQEPTIPGPAGTAIGQRSGALQWAPDIASPSAFPPSTSVGSAPPVPPTTAPPLSPASSTARTTGQRPLSSDPQHFSTEKIEQLMSMGASRETAIHALHAAQGNVEAAAGLIFFGA